MVEDPSKNSREFEFDCPMCLGGIIVAEDLAGQEIACPHCDRPVIVPAEPPHMAGRATESDRAYWRAKPSSRAQICGDAGTALTFAIIGLLFCGLAFGWIAIFFAVRAKRKIAEDPQLGGLLMAQIALGLAVADILLHFALMIYLILLRAGMVG